MKSFLGLLSLILALPALISAQSLRGPSSLSFRIKQLPPHARTHQNLVIELAFSNTSQEPLKLMTAVGAVTASSLNLLSIYLKQKKGESIEIVTPGKVDYEASFVGEYTTILPGKSYKKILNITKLLHEKSIPFQPGAYTLEMYYYNQVGENCMKGVFPANTLSVHLPE